MGGGDLQITAVENNPMIAEAYKKLFPNDEVIIGDALQYLENNFMNFDFIWASPVCVSHSDFRRMWAEAKRYAPIIPDMSLYGIIIFLRQYFKGLFCVENVKPYYKALIAPSAIIGRHYFWTNFFIGSLPFETNVKIRDIEMEFVRNHETFSVVADLKGINKRQVLKNCVDSEIGKYILECAMKKFTAVRVKTPLFEMGVD